MTAEPLTAAEASVVARFDAAPPAEESAVERVARAIGSEAIGVTLETDDEWDYYLRPDEQEDYRRLATAALTAMRPAPDTAKADEGAALRAAASLCYCDADLVPPHPAHLPWPSDAAS